MCKAKLGTELRIAIPISKQILKSKCRRKWANFVSESWNHFVLTQSRTTGSCHLVPHRLKPVSSQSLECPIQNPGPDTLEEAKWEPWFLMGTAQGTQAYTHQPNEQTSHQKLVTLGEAFFCQSSCEPMRQRQTRASGDSGQMPEFIHG